MLENSSFQNPEALEQLHNLFSAKEHEILKGVEELSKNVAKTEMRLFEFEVLYSLLVSEEKREETMELVKKVREKRWQEALKKANGDEDKITFFY